MFFHFLFHQVDDFSQCPRLRWIVLDFYCIYQGLVDRKRQLVYGNKRTLKDNTQNIRNRKFYEKTLRTYQTTWGIEISKQNTF
jgi:hypothetical protein